MRHPDKKLGEFYSEPLDTPSGSFSRVSSCKFSVTAPSDTSSTRAATPPPVNSVNVSLNREICSQSTSCTQLINLGVSKGHLFNAVNWATCLHRLAKLFPTEAKNHKSIILSFLNSAHDVLLSGVEGFKFQPQHLATLLWAMAKLNIVDHSFVGDLVKRALSVANSLKAQDMANIAWSLAKMGMVHYPDMFRMICNRISDRSGIISQFKPMEIASTTWAFGTIGYKGMGIESKKSIVIDSLVNECLTRDLRDFSPQALANVLWAMAKLEYPHDSLFSVFGDHVINCYRLREFKPQELANVIWAMESVGLPHTRLYHEIATTKAINWITFDPHALVTVSASLLNLFSENFALVLASRVISPGSSSSLLSMSIQQSGILLCILEPHLGDPIVASATSMVANKLLTELVCGASVDAHTVRGLVSTFCDSVSLVDQLGRCSIVEAEYGKSGELVSVVSAIRGVMAMKTVPQLNKIELVKSLLKIGAPLMSKHAISLENTAMLLEAAHELDVVSDELITGVGKTITQLNLIRASVSIESIGYLVDMFRVISSAHSTSHLNVCRFLGAACLETLKTGKLDLEKISSIVRSANRLDFVNGAERPDPVVAAVLTAVVSDVAVHRPIEYTKSADVLSDVFFELAEFVSRHRTNSGLEKHAKGIANLCATIAKTYPKGPDYFSLNSQAKIISAISLLGMDIESIWKQEWANRSFLSQFLIAGPGGLALLKDNLESFRVFCKVLAAHVSMGTLPGSWIETSQLTEPARKDPFSLEAALSLSVALGNVGAVDTQKDVIGCWVLPLMTGSINAAPEVVTPETEVHTAQRFLSSLLASPQLRSSSESRIRSLSDLLTKCMTTATDDPWFTLPS
jgi:hypothetical protein